MSSPGASHMTTVGTAPQFFVAFGGSIASPALASPPNVHLGSQATGLINLGIELANTRHQAAQAHLRHVDVYQNLVHANHISDGTVRGHEAVQMARDEVWEAQRVVQRSQRTLDYLLIMAHAVQTGSGVQTPAYSLQGSHSNSFNNNMVHVHQANQSKLPFDFFKFVQKTLNVPSCGKLFPGAFNSS
ncbi:hypothetical protein DACRYDRAFT_115085 [Dacryopinax primogenitus]|uniref:Uncharacterized protein n=1 Tax=Dacryopinax primogenitus (strain DJM 731) TaxID=1858805 RepID=M5G513_DACPD|nr:uncharacterized protein DACRYDRAFT_115085 [Dacryopinax primogenitus]EJU03749.1 hypothetical protein DACRYDRAFT_115085 [Dacryopinax primogenitus]